MEKVKLGGSLQWVTIRGKDRRKPVLLFLAGGPGGSELVWLRKYAAPLEDYFVVVNWDQPGAGKSYTAAPLASLTVDRYVSDAYELARLLCVRFQQDKIFVMGASWGAVLGVKVVQEHPDLFLAYIGSGQMITTTANDVMGYELALQYATERGEVDTIKALHRAGPPPYVGAGALMAYSQYLNVLNRYMSEHTRGEFKASDMLMDALKGSEYGWLDKINWLRGLNDTFNVFYPKLADLDLTTQANVLIWFEKSGHVPHYEEPALFADMLVNRVLMQSQTAH